MRAWSCGRVEEMVPGTCWLSGGPFAPQKLVPPFKQPPVPRLSPPPATSSWQHAKRHIRTRKSPSLVRAGLAKDIAAQKPLSSIESNCSCPYRCVELVPTKNRSLPTSHLFESSFLLKELHKASRDSHFLQ